MDFAKKQLEKYGWQEGQGLGKNKSGINVAIKPKLKFDTAGIGHNVSEEFTNKWWEKLYNTAADNVNVIRENDRIQVNIRNPDAVEISTKNYSIKNFKKDNNDAQYKGTFIKTSKLIGSGIIALNNNKKTQLDTKINASALTDEELFAACGGRTAHKGARHGMKLNGKLTRLDKQEKLLTKKLNKISLSEPNNSKNNKRSIEKKLKKIEAHKIKSRPQEDMDFSSSGSGSALNDLELSITMKKRKKERKRVSFNEIAIEYQTQELESNTASNSNSDLDLQNDQNLKELAVTTVKHVKIKDVNENSIDESNSSAVDQDEGIDCVEFESTVKGNTDLQLKIKRDNKRMRRKLKQLRRQETIDMLESNTNTTIDQSLHESETCVGCNKRKIKHENEDCSYIKIRKCQYDISKISKREKPDKSVDNVTNYFNNCKISDLESG